MKNYYKHNGIEAWEIIDLVLQYFGDSLSNTEAFFVGNILKYLLRFPFKRQRNSDIKKATVYFKKLRT